MLNDRLAGKPLGLAEQQQVPYSAAFPQRKSLSLVPAVGGQAHQPPAKLALRGRFSELAFADHALKPLLRAPDPVLGIIAVGGKLAENFAGFGRGGQGHACVNEIDDIADAEFMVRHDRFSPYANATASSSQNKT
jgi:hypothetical protein